MENRDFDALARELAQGLSRREALRRVCGGFAGAILASLGAGRAWGDQNPCAAYCNKLPKSQRSNCNNACKQCNGNVQNLCPSLTTSQVACCTSGASCCAGACCSAGSGCCGSVCTPLGTNQNCTHCGDACTGGKLCVSATAGCQCPTGSAVCQGGTACCPSDHTCCAGVCCAAGLGCSGTGCCHPTLTVCETCVFPTDCSTFCCSGMCLMGTSGPLDNQLYCCANNGTTCNFDTDCCENKCDSVFGKCCGEARPGGGGSCTVDSDCCGRAGVCKNGRCDCLPGGAACSSNSECCLGSCANGTCACISGGSCTEEGADYFCCPGEICAIVVPGQQAPNCCKLGGGHCTLNTDCCSGDCDPQSSTCVCSPHGAPCFASDFANWSCCSGICGRDGTCFCIPSGSLCAHDIQCCSGVCNGSTCA